MEKELKSCTGVLLTADLTGHGHSSHSAKKARVGWLCPVRSALKGTPVEDLNSFSIMFYCTISTTYKKILFCLVHIFGLTHSV